MGKFNRKHLFVMNKSGQPGEWETADFLELVTFGSVAGVLTRVRLLSQLPSVTF